MSFNKTLLVPTGLPAGMNDYGPQQMIVRQQMLDIIKAVYRRFGFCTLQTSLVQRRRVLVGDEGTSMRLWQMSPDSKKISTDPDVQLAARFDLTVPLAEYVARNMRDLQLPFRRIECGYVYRGEKPQAGRFCGFMQFDADIVGAQTGPADAEVIWCMTEVMHALGFTQFLVRINNRKILNGLSEMIGIDPWSPRAAWMIRLLDKLDKLERPQVLRELGGIKEEDEEPQEEIFALDADQLRVVSRFLEDGQVNTHDELAALRTFFAGQTDVGLEGVRELEQIADLLTAANVDPRVWSVDRTVARGLSYYTGPVFETVLTNAREFGSVFSGGRFDDLVARFTGETLPSVGASIGVDRLFDAMERLGLTATDQAEVDVFLLSFGPQFSQELFGIMSDLRRGGVSCELFMGYQDSSFGKQLKMALARKATLAIIYGDRERSTGLVSVKNLSTRTQEQVSRTNLVEYVLTTLNRTR